MTNTRKQVTDSRSLAERKASITLRLDAMRAELAKVERVAAELDVEIEAAERARERCNHAAE